MLKNKKKTLLRNKLDEAKKYFSNSEKYKTSLSLASNLFEQSNLEACRDILDKLPTRDSLLKTLVSKLEGKSIYRTLKKIHEDKEVDTLMKAKGISSLITHVLIEMESGNSEFSILLPQLLEKENELLYQLWD